MHAAEDKHDNADLATDCLKHFAHVCRGGALFQSEGDVTDVDQIKTDNQKMVDRVGQFFVSVKRIDQKDASVLMKRVCYPDGERNAESDINNVSPNNWSHGDFLSWFVFSIKFDRSFQKFERPGNHLVLLRLRELRDHSVSQFEKITQRFNLLVESRRFGTS